MIAKVMATVAEVLAQARADLREDSEYPARDAVLLLAAALDKPASYPHLHPEDMLSPEVLERFYELIRRRKTGEPVAYLRGYQEFMGFRFSVDRRVLIPRPETEILVEAAAAELRNQVRSASHSAGLLYPLTRLSGEYHIADICCGSGAIGLSLAKMLPASRVVLTDCSRDALDVARTNAVSLGVGDRVSFMAGDLAEPLVRAGMAGQFDLIASNPPYIARDELEGLQRDVRCFEPRGALDGGQDGLEFVGRLAVETPSLLCRSGSIFVEIGSDQGPACEDLFARSGFWRHGRLILDLAGKHRVFRAQKA